MSDVQETIARTGAVKQAPALGKLGPYILVDYIGRGGAGIVYRARDADKAEVAVKVMTATPAVSHAEIARFLREAETSKLLRKHPNIITVYDTGQDGQDYYIAMELVPGGKTLSDLEGKKLPVKEILNYVIPVAKALEYAHQEGIVHRDLKPANILINEFNQPLLADFGLAKMETSQQLTMTGTVMGTPWYMTPEQCGMGDGEYTQQSDIYAFGFMLYELLTGVPPYPLNTEMQLPEIFSTIREVEPVPPRKLRKDISRNLEAVILRTLEKEKKLRYKEMSQVRADLEACLAGAPVSVRRLSWAEEWEKWLRKHSSQAIIAAVAIAIGVSLYYFLVVPWMKGSGFAKQNADLDAVAAKHKADRLEEELILLKKTDATPDEEAKTIAMLQKGREAVAAGRLDDAESKFRSAADWAEKNGHKGMLLESRSFVARIALAKGEKFKAAQMFQEISDAYGKNTLNGKIALFECAAAKWLQEDDAEACKIWQLLAGMDSAAADVDIKTPGGYIKFLSKAMLDRGKSIGANEVTSSCPQLFRGLAYWVLAQCTVAGKMKEEYLSEASKNKGIFIWIRQEVGHEAGK